VVPRLVLARGPRALADVLPLPFLAAFFLGPAAGVYSAARTGKAQLRLHGGSFTFTASTTHLCPHLKTVWPQDERTASRWHPLAQTFLPGWRATVSSQSSITGCSAGTSSSTAAASTLASGHIDQRAALKKR